MRRKDREITDFEQIVSIMQECDVCRLGLYDGEFPYILPMNFGVERVGEQLTLYFHSAKEGKKHELIARSNKAAFEMDQGHKLVIKGDPESCTMEYESIMGKGMLCYIEDMEEKRRAMDILMAHYRPGTSFEYNEKVLGNTAMLKLCVLEVSCKKH